LRTIPAARITVHFRQFAEGRAERYRAGNPPDHFAHLWRVGFAIKGNISQRDERRTALLLINCKIDEAIQDGGELEPSCARAHRVLCPMTNIRRARELEKAV
jgi:hypothetical protein